MSNPKNKQKSSSKRQALRQQRLKRQRQQRVLAIVVIGVVAIVVAGVLIVPQIIEASKPVGEIIKITPNPRPQEKANAIGDPNAPVKFEEYADFQCPGCKQFSDQTEPQIVDAYVKTGKVYFILHSMGNWVSGDIIGRGGTESRDAAEAAYCAGDQNKFWEYKDMLFANWQGEDVGSFRPKRLIAFAETLGLDMGQFQTCINDNKYRNQVLQDNTNGRKAGVIKTPSFFINGKLVEWADLEKEIEAALAGK